MKRLSAVLLAFVLVVSACGSDDPVDGSGSGDGASTTGAAGADYSTLKVPDDYATIQEAVDAAEPGDLVLISEGTYPGGINVETENVVIRGVDRNAVIIDGEFEAENGFRVFSDGVAVENLTVRNNLKNGVFFTGEYSDDTSKNKILTGYRASYITAYNNGLYGVYAFNATTGQFDNSYGSGHPDSAFYIGQCNPCDAVITDVEAELNMLGYSGTNSTGVTIVNSTWHDNRSGIDPNSLNSEKLAPNSGTLIVGNLVYDNNSAEAPANEGLSQAFANGIVLGGTSNNIVERNLITGNQLGGVVVTDLPDGFKPEGNEVRDNVFADNKYDLIYLTVNFASTLFGNCFEGNEIAASFPEGLQEKAPCGGPDVDLGDLSAIVNELPTSPPDADWKKVRAPGDQENMPDAETAPPRPATDVPMKIDVDAIEVPTR